MKTKKIDPLKIDKTTRSKSYSRTTYGVSKYEPLVYPLKSRQIHRKTPASESLSDKTADLQRTTLLQKDSDIVTQAATCSFSKFWNI